MPERVPQVEITVQWLEPYEATAVLKCNSDRAGARATDAVNSAVQAALESESGVGSVTITIRRKARRPARVQIY